MFRIVLAFLFLFFLSSSALAGLKEEIEQLSPEEAKEILNKLQEKAKKAEKTESGVKLATYSPSLAELNSFLSARGAGTVASGMTMAQGIYKHNFTPEWQAGLSYTSASTGSGSKNAVGDVGVSTVSLNIIEITASYKFPNIPFEPFAEAGLGYYWGGYQVSVTPAGGPTTIHQWGGSTVGERLGLGIRYVQREFFGFSFVADVDANYVFAKIGSVSEGGVTDPAAPPMDLGGWLFRLGGQISF